MQIITWEFGNPKHFCHLNVVPMVKSKIYYLEEGGDLFQNPGHVNVVSQRQVHDSKLVPFPLTTCIV
jgi:hypothetical protein